MSSNIRGIQVVNHHVRNQYEELQEIIERETGVKCSVLVTPHVISIRTRYYRDYALARAAILGRTTTEIVRDE